MRHKVTWIIGAVSVIAIVLVGLYVVRIPRSAHASAADATITAVSIPNTFGGQYTNANALNNAGHIVGSADTSTGNDHAFFWYDTLPQLRDITPDGAAWAGAGDINNADQIIGSIDSSYFASGNVEWTAPDKSAAIQVIFPSGMSGNTHAINDAGQVVGSMSDGINPGVAVIWKNGVSVEPQILLSPPNGFGCDTTDINNQGEIIGTCNFSSPNGDYSEPVYWPSPDAQPLVSPTVFRPLSPDGGLYVAAINDQGHSVGISGVSTFQAHATMWLHPTDPPIDMGPVLPPDERCSDCGIANGVNNLDQAVGLAVPVGPALFESGVVIGLPTPSDCPGSGWAFAINDAGQAVGGMSSCGRAILWENIAPPPTPQQQIAAITTQVQDLVTANSLNTGDGNALQTSLNAASASITNGNNNATCNQLQAFTNKVQATVRSRRLTTSQGQSLMNAATPLISKYCH